MDSLERVIHAMFVIGMGFLLMMLFMHFTVAVGWAQEHQHPPQDVELHEQFYSTWLRPDIGRVGGNRTQSCCSQHDCYPVETRMRNGKWEFLRREDNAWVVVRDGIIESEQPDPRESPDGQSHVCATTSWTYCFVLGGGI